MLKILFFLFVVNFNFQIENFHAASRKITKFEIKNWPRKKWNGHFSAENFSNSTSRKKLGEIKKILDATIFDLPGAHTSALKNLKIRNEKNISRGMASGRTIVLNTASIESKKELIAVFVHEIGHVVDLGMLREIEKKQKSEFFDGAIPIWETDPSLEFYRISWKNSDTRKNARRADFVSGYAMTDPFEDFAESYIFFRLHGEKFRAFKKFSPKLAQKYNFLKTKIFAGREFQLEKTTKNFPKNIIWDVTQINF